MNLRLPSSHHSRGSAFVATIWIIAALTGLTLALAHSARVEALAAANRLALAQAEAAEKGAEQFILSAVEAELATPGEIVGSAATSGGGMDMEALDIGGAYIWIIKPDPVDETAITFGLSDEGGKIDINRATNDQLLLLPNMTQENVDCILDWRDTDATQRSTGAEDNYYTAPDASLGKPAYHCKNAPFETLEELLMVKSITPELLWGQDLTRSGHAPATSDMMTATITFVAGGGTSNRGIFPFITIYGQKAATQPPNTESAGISGAARQANVNNPNRTFQNALTSALGATRTAQIVQKMDTLQPPLRIRAGSGALYAFQNTLQWAAAVDLTAAEFAKVFGNLTATPTVGATTPPLSVNVNTAPRQVLLCIPGLEQNDADAIVSRLQQNTNAQDPADISWLLDVVPKNKLRTSAPYFRGTSSCFSADILACSADGRAFKRVRVVVDGSTGTPQILYRRDMSSYGWPLDPQIRTDLRQGKSLFAASPMMRALP